MGRGLRGLIVDDCLLLKLEMGMRMRMRMRIECSKPVRMLFDFILLAC